MSRVQTISGVVDSSDLGWTLSHEHLVTGTGGVERIPGLYDAEDAYRRSLAALEQVHAAGVRTIIDCTAFDLGRQPALFERIAESSPVQIVAATGTYRWVPFPYFRMDPDTLAKLFLVDLQEGLDGRSSVKAGIVKIAWDLEYRLDEGDSRSPRAHLEKVARAAARAARTAGVPITCHTRPLDRHGDRLLDIFEEEGLDLRAVTIGHSNDTDDADYLLGLLRRGANVGLDRFNLRDEGEALRRSQLALTLIRAGFAEQISLGHDSVAYSMNVGPATGGPSVENPECWLPIPKQQVPWLREQGVTDDEIDAATVRSVRATFEAASRMALG